MFGKRNSDIEFLNAGYRYALSLSANQQDSEDLVHDAWIRLQKRYGRSPDKPLLFRTIRNLYIDQYRRARKIRFEEFVEASIDAGAEGLENDLMSAEMVELVLDRLRDVEREALYLSVVEGYTADEIASMTGSVRGTVLSMLHRSKARLRHWLNSDAGEQAGADVIELPGRSKNA